MHVAVRAEFSQGIPHAVSLPRNRLTDVSLTGAAAHWQPSDYSGFEVGVGHLTVQCLSVLPTMGTWVRKQIGTADN